MEYPLPPPTMEVVLRLLTLSAVLAELEKVMSATKKKQEKHAVLPPDLNTPPPPYEEATSDLVVGPSAFEDEEYEDGAVITLS